MRPAAFLALLVGCCLVSAGCLNPAFTRMPNCQVPNLFAERNSIERFDPFPSEEIGPETFSRPLSYVKQRSEPRRDAELRTFFGYPLQQAPLGPRIPTSSYQYPNVVR